MVLRWLPLLFFVACAGLLGSLLLAERPEYQSAWLGKPFPVHTDAETLHKPLAPLTDVPAITIYNVFASWCAPCAAEMPLFSELSTYDAIRVIGIAWNDKPAALNKFLDKNGNPFDIVYHDAKGRWGIDLGIRGVPESFVVSDQGVVLMHIPGEMTRVDANKIKTLAESVGQ